MTAVKISKTLADAATALFNAGKTPWVVLDDGTVEFVCGGRAAAREYSKTHEFKGHHAICKASEVEFQVAGDAVANQQAVTDAAQAEAPKTTGKIPLVRQSTVERPCKKVWHIADAFLAAAGGDLKKMKRKDVLAYCVSEGIAYYTARTQYQLWLTIQNGGSI